MGGLFSVFNQVATDTQRAENKIKLFQSIPVDDLATVSSILSKYSDALDWKYNGSSVLDTVACEGRRLVTTAVLEACLKKGRKDLLDQSNADGQTPLVQALLRRSTWVAEAILDAGANPHAGDPMMTAARWAQQEGNKGLYPGLCDKINQAVAKRIEDMCMTGLSHSVKKMKKMEINPRRKKAGA